MNYEEMRIREGISGLAKNVMRCKNAMKRLLAFFGSRGQQTDQNRKKIKIKKISIKDKIEDRYE